MSTIAELIALRRKVRELISDHELIELIESRLHNYAVEFGAQIEEAIRLAHAAGFESCRKAAIAEIVTRCNAIGVDMKIESQLVTTLAALERGESP